MADSKYLTPADRLAIMEQAITFYGHNVPDDGPRERYRDDQYASLLYFAMSIEKYILKDD